MTNKYRYLKVIQYNCGYGWEDVDETEEEQNAMYLLQEYSLAYRGNGSVRMINRRELA